MNTHRIVNHLTPTLLFLSLTLSAPQVVAEQPSTAGALQAVDADGSVIDMPLRHTGVTVEITAFVARVNIEQVFLNPFDVPVEALYTFPLGDRAAVDDFRLTCGPHTIRGEIRTREEARREYREARDQGYVAALLEQERPNIFTQSVANLMPGHEIRVSLRTVELLEYTAGTYQFTFPLVVGPRYVPGGESSPPTLARSEQAPADPAHPSPAVPDADRIRPPYLEPGYRSGHDVSIDVSLVAGVPLGAIVSPSHRIETTSSGHSRARVVLAPDDRLPNKDFVLRWDVGSEEPAVSVLSHRDGVDGFFALLVQPKGEVDAEDASPKEIIFVLDTSGSMRGAPLRLSKRVAAAALRTLGPNDTFNVVRFASGSTTFSVDPLPNLPRKVDRALDWINKLQGGGGTKMLEGLRGAFDRPPDPDRVRLAVFLTDGYIGNEAQILSAIGEVVGEARIFTLGIGSSVNHYLLGRMAELGRGAYTFVPDDGDAERMVDRFRSWVTRPYLTDLEIDWGALPVLDTLPDPPPDLFSGQTLSVVGRYAGVGEGRITVRGRLGGRYWEQDLDVVLPGEESANAALASVWARRRIDRLQMSSPGSVPDDVREEVTRLGLEFRLMTSFTSFVAVDYSEVVNPAAELEMVREVLPLPEGVPVTAVTEVEKVVARRDVVELEKTASSATFNDEFIGDLPARGRFHSNVLSLAPGVQDEDGDGSPNVHGARERDFRTLVGGVANLDPLTGLRLTNINTDSVEDVEVVTAGAGVEYGRAQGGYANIIERQGSNVLEGEVEMLWMTDELDGDGATGVDAGELPDFGAILPSIQLAGPIVKDGLWFSLSHEYVRRDDPIDVIDRVVERSLTQARHADRLTWQVSPRNQLSFRFASGPAKLENVGVSRVVPAVSTTRREFDDRAYSLHWTAPYSPRLLVESAVAYQEATLGETPSVAGTPNECTPASVDATLGTAWCFDSVAGRVTGSAPRHQRAGHRRLTVNSRASVFAGRFLGASHQFKLGLEIEDERYVRQLTRDPSLVRFSQGILLERFAPSETSATTGAGTYWSVYLEDQVKPLSNVTLTAGVRIDRETVEFAGIRPFDPRAEISELASRAEDLPASGRIFLSGRVFTAPQVALLSAETAGIVPGSTAAPESAAIDNSNVSPFLSVAWDPWSSGETKFAFSARRYYDRTDVMTPGVEGEPFTTDVELALIDGSVQATGPAYVNVQAVDRGLRTPYQDELMLSFEREVAAETALRVSYVRRRFRDQFRQVDLNHAPGDYGRCVEQTVPGGPLVAPITDPADPLFGAFPNGGDGVLDDCGGALFFPDTGTGLSGALERPDGRPDSYIRYPFWGDIFLLGNSGAAEYRAYVFDLVRRQYRNWAMGVSYTCARATGDGEGFDPLAGDERTLLEDTAGFQSFDRRHAVKIYGTTVVPWLGGFRLGGVVTWKSGLPYSTLEYEISREAVPPALFGLREAASRSRLRYVTGSRNDGRNTGYWNLDARVVKEVHVKSRTGLELSLEVFNLLNDDTFVIYNEDLERGRYIAGVHEATRRFGRRFQLGVRVVF